MALNKNDLIALINSNLPDNTSKSITPQKHREVATQSIDSALNTTETTAQTVAGSTNFSTSLKKGGTDVLIGANDIEVFRASSTAASQLPSALGTAIQVEYGAAQTTTYFDLAVDGALTCKVSGYYGVRVKLQFGRGGAAGISVLMSRLLKNGVQLGASQVERLSSSDSISATDSRVVMQLTAGDVLTTQVIRDSAGTNAGGLYAVTSSHGWNLAPSALLVIDKVVGVA